MFPSELEEYELALEEQAYPFEEKSIEVHKSNLELISRGVYNDWIDRSLQKLAEIVPARYDKPEETSDVVNSLETYIFALVKPVADVQADMPDSMVPAQPEQPGEVETDKDAQDTVPEPTDEFDAMTDIPGDQPLPEADTQPVVSETTNELVLRVDESAADEISGDVSEAKEGSLKVKIP